MFAGAGTTPIVARKLNRNFYAGEPSAAYLRLAEKRMYDELGFFT
jgi:DNA modification methylase